MKEIMSDIHYANMETMLKDCLCDVVEGATFNNLPGISTGFQSLDKLIGGFERGKVYIVGSRPCMGKEELMLSIIENIILESKLPVLMFSTNYMKSEYIQRLLAIYCDIPVMHLFHGLMEPHEWERVGKIADSLLDAPLFMHESLDLPLNELIETVRNCVLEKNIKIIFIDCLQMIDFDNENNKSSERIAKVMLSLKELARLNGISVVVGSMINRDVEYRDGVEGKKPMLADLANSSYIEGLADVVMMVHRPEYYRIFEADNGRDLHGLMEIIVKKNGLKPLDGFFLDYHPDTGVICETGNTNKAASKTVSLEDFETDNKAVKKLIDTLHLEESPF